MCGVYLSAAGYQILNGFHGFFRLECLDAYHLYLDPHVVELVSQSSDENTLPLDFHVVFGRGPHTAAWGDEVYNNLVCHSIHNCSI